MNFKDRNNFKILKYKNDIKDKEFRIQENVGLYERLSHFHIKTVIIQVVGSCAM